MGSAGRLPHLLARSDPGPSSALVSIAIRCASGGGLYPLLERFAVLSRPYRRRLSDSESSSDDGDMGETRHAARYALYVPAPSYCNDKQAYGYHLGTRNFFAWMFCKPIVGHDLGQALLSLGERMALFRSGRQERNLSDLLDYLDEQAYSDFRECLDHALGVLLFAEQHQLHQLWIDAFAHCVGMNDRLGSSPGFEVSGHFMVSN